MGVHSAPRGALVASMTTSPSRLTIHDLLSAIRREGEWPPPPDWHPRLNLDGHVSADVHAAHPGAGASTVAVALTDVLPRRSEGDVTLVDLSPDPTFGASETTHVQADLGLEGWEGGRRGLAKIVRLAPPAEPVALTGNMVIDSGSSLMDRGPRVLACRPTILSARRVEHTLPSSEHRIIAVVGASKWPSVVRRSLGPRLDRATAEHRVVFFPLDNGLEVHGLSADPLPASTLRAADRLAELLDEIKTLAPSSEPSGERA